MKVEWTEHVRWQRKQIADYICKSFGTRRARIFKQEVGRTTKLLGSHPNIGPIDPLFSDRPNAYRSIIINGLSKLVYRIDGDSIRIVAFWDTRREPKNQASQTK